MDDIASAKGNTETSGLIIKCQSPNVKGWMGALILILVNYLDLRERYSV